MLAMKLQLWIINSALVGVFFLAFILSDFTRQEPPVLRIRPIIIGKEMPVEATPVPAPPVPIKNWEKIYQNDPFNTYEVPRVPNVKKSFVTPIPEPQSVSFTPPPEPKQVEFLPPLTLTLKGIIVAADEINSVVMIADESGKERMCHLGDRIKDADIIKISRNKVVMLRANGQQETFYLIKEDLSAQAPERWNNIVKKINDQSYKIDPYTFAEEVDSLGNFIERAGVIGVAYSGGSAIGVKIGDTKNCDVATNLGLVQNDIIRAVNGLDVSDSKNRTKIYDSIVNMKPGSKIQLDLTRAGQNLAIDYELAKLERTFRKPLPPGVQESKGPMELPMNQLQEREKKMREFSQYHKGDERRQQNTSDLRKKLLENLHARLRQARLR